MADVQTEAFEEIRTTLHQSRIRCADSERDAMATVVAEERNAGEWRVEWFELDRGRVLIEMSLQLVAADVVKFLESNVTTNPLVLHGFSVGGYVWGECMVHMAADTKRYKTIIDNINGQIWDSVTDITEIPIGVPKAMFPSNDTLQRAVSNYMLYHMKTFHEPATSHYIRSSQMFYSTLVKKPALLFLSHSDPIGAVSSNKQLRESWESLGISCEWKCWDKSPHVGHFLKHRDEYVETLMNFLQSINMVHGQREEKERAQASN